MAIEVGYRHIDTAFLYDNHKAVGRAIKHFDREELFVTSKILLGNAYGISHVDFDNIVPSVNASVDLALSELQTDYLDLMMIHWPNSKVPMDQVLLALEQNPKVLSIGTSNFTEKHLQKLYDTGLKIPYNQVEFHPYLNQKELLDFCRDHGTELIAFRPFGKGKLLAETKLAPRVILRWLFQKGIAVIVKASSREHLKENLEIFDFSLSDQEMEELDALNRNQRFCNQPWAEFD